MQIRNEDKEEKLKNRNNNPMKFRWIHKLL
jgi:hypothetical protein